MRRQIVKGTWLNLALLFLVDVLPIRNRFITIEISQVSVDYYNALVLKILIREFGRAEGGTYISCCMLT
jgi:hypothetical protein